MFFGTFILWVILLPIMVLFCSFIVLISGVLWTLAFLYVWGAVMKDFARFRKFRNFLESFP